MVDEALGENLSTSVKVTWTQSEHVLQEPPKVSMNIKGRGSMHISALVEPRLRAKLAWHDTDKQKRTFWGVFHYNMAMSLTQYIGTTKTINI